MCRHNTIFDAAIVAALLKSKARAFELEGYVVCVDDLTLSDQFKADYEGYLYERDRDGTSTALEDIESIRLYFCSNGTIYIDINYYKEVC